MSVGAEMINRVHLIDQSTGKVLSKGIWPMWRFEEGMKISADQKLWEIVSVGSGRPMLVWVVQVK